MIVWNIEKDEEIANVSTDQPYYIVSGPNSKYGFLMYGNLYMNLDNCL